MRSCAQLIDLAVTLIVVSCGGRGGRFGGAPVLIRRADYRTHSAAGHRARTYTRYGRGFVYLQTDNGNETISPHITFFPITYNLFYTFGVIH